MKFKVNSQEDKYTFNIWNNFQLFFMTLLHLSIIQQLMNVLAEETWRFWLDKVIDAFSDLVNCFKVLIS